MWSCSQRNQAGYKLAEHTFYTRVEPLYTGLIESFGCDSADTPDVVVCDVGSPGCHEFALLVNATLLISVCDAMSIIDWVAHDPRVPAFLEAAEWNLTLDLVENALAEYRSLSVVGTLKRLALRAAGTGFQWFIARQMANAPASFGWSKVRPSTPFGDTLAYQRVVLLQTTFFPFELPRTLSSNTIMVGPPLPRSLLQR